MTRDEVEAYIREITPGTEAVVEACGTGFKARVRPGARLFWLIHGSEAKVWGSDVTEGRQRDIIRVRWLHNLERWNARYS